MAFGSTLWEGTKSAASTVGGALKKGADWVADTSVFKSFNAELGNVEKAVIEIADYSDRKIQEEVAAKPGGGKAIPAIGGMSGSGSFDAKLVESYGTKVGAIAEGVKKAGNGAGEQFEINKHFQRFRFVVPFNPNEITITGYGGEEMMVQSFMNTEKKKEEQKDSQQGGQGKHRPGNKISVVDPHIEMNIPLIFDKTNNQDAFYSDKFTLSPTNIARGVGKAALNSFMGSDYSVQNEVEAFTYILRSNDMQLMSFTWGDMAYQGVLNGVSAEYTMFNVNGEPCRATVNLRLVLLDSDYRDMTRLWVSKYRKDVGYDEEAALTAQVKKLGTQAH